ncbi:glutamate--cysteine ligase [Rhodococcus triatomae]|uniref:Glutamate-cysteine ligase family 2(GCS2) n=1 Tax=Rhodococcus triatomae TaxID=300028 RepID=A0A1G8AJ51_9NOCA|nr:glutamate-cysteine ligase family protein [Rhodococcus triatomae]QNG17750.1 glutamate--cysteine ligase [Rhodococcus triatomae]QNG22582.1 glutamate--cysteine ligase [Rhodococcus triatomae]SDH21035.1 Glutamate-cysteine ligase family 2(GCS2) [Rhodococcus triatomae]
MGDKVTAREFTRADRREFRRKVQRCSDALERMLSEGRFVDDVEPFEPLLGMEIELNLVRADMSPAMVNVSALAAIDDDSVFQPELGQFNVEMNVRPGPLAGEATFELERGLRASLHLADARIREQDAALVMIGMLPTLELEHLDYGRITANPRYELLNQQIFAARGEDIELDVEGVALPGRDADVLRADTDSVAPEAACTSLQLHLRVAPDEFAAHWNTAQCLAGVQVATAANSPFLAGRALWHESRVPIFEQATDTRPPELRNQGVRPRVWFGERWIDSALDLFEENARYFPALLPELDEEDPLERLESGETPALSELQMHNGTIYRWNRPVYDHVDGDPHLRIENRVLPAGPTVLDMMANAALYYGVIRSLVDSGAALWERMPFEDARHNLAAGARYGMEAQVRWPGLGLVPVDELVLRHLLPLADAGLADFGLSAKARDRYLDVIEGRCRTRQTGAAWQRDQVVRREAAGENRRSALVGMLGDYVGHMREGDPVHTWV